MPIEMNSRREKFNGVQVLSHSHAGLWLERYVEKVGDKKGGNATTIGDVTKAVCISGEYQRHFKRWERELLKKEQENKAITKKATVQGRLVVGLGAESILETAITLHRTYGVPFIPGSALKGLASAAAHRFLANDEWRKKTKTVEQGESHTIMFGNTKTAAFVTFHDALLVPEGEPIPLDLDVMTVHHRDYYGTGKSPPADWDSPNPVSFVTARGTYLIALEGPEEWTRAAMDILGDALQEDGIGAKTAAGYGRMKVDGYITREEKDEAQRIENERLEKQRQEEVRVRQRNAVQAQAWRNDVEMSNARERVLFVLDNVPVDERVAAATQMINKLTRKSLKAKREQRWVQELFSAAGEPLP